MALRCVDHLAWCREVEYSHVGRNGLRAPGDAISLALFADGNIGTSTVSLRGGDGPDRDGRELTNRDPKDHL